jgi:hypothetical protein
MNLNGYYGPPIFSPGGGWGEYSDARALLGAHEMGERAPMGNRLKCAPEICMGMGALGRTFELNFCLMYVRMGLLEMTHNE